MLHITTFSIRTSLKINLLRIIFLGLLLGIQNFLSTDSSAKRIKNSEQEWIYALSDYDKIEGDNGEKSLGVQGVNLVKMLHLGVPIPPGFIIKPSFLEFYKKNGVFPQNFSLKIKNALNKVKKQTLIAFKNSQSPLLITLRADTKIQIPGVEKTILYIGLNDKTTEQLRKITGNGNFAFNTYRRFIEAYGCFVLGMNMLEFDKIIQTYKTNHSIQNSENFSENDLREIIEAYKEKIKEVSKKTFPQDLSDQLLEIIKAISENYKVHSSSEEGQKGLIVQAMSLEDIGNLSGMGEAFTRNPFTGENEFFGYFLKTGKDVDVISNPEVIQPLTLSQKQKKNQLSFEEEAPFLHKELCKYGKILERSFGDTQHIEFIIQNGKLWILQTEQAKREPLAALKIALDMQADALATKKNIIKNFDPLIVQSLLHPKLAADQPLHLLGKGIAVSPGGATGKILLSTDEKVLKKFQEENYILVLQQTTPEDIQGMSTAQGILTSQGGVSCHAAVVARGIGKPCVVGFRELTIDKNNKKILIGNTPFQEGDIITIDGATGEVFKGKGEIKKADISDGLKKILSWADSFRRLKVRANAETIQDTQAAISFGAEGIGLCRTEHMFFEEDRLPIIQKAILANDKQERKQQLERIFQFQQQDFYNLLKSMKGLPVTVRLLDPPLHEFLPENEEKIKKLAKELGTEIKNVKARINELREANPMLGNRGCRLGITAPEIYEMQVEALLKTIAQLEEEREPYQLEIMVPFVTFPEELKQIRNMIDSKADEIRKTHKAILTYKVGTMIETPQAALRAGEIAVYADFISFGTNDLTQTALGISRDDASSFLKIYQKRAILHKDPFASLSQSGVNELISIAVKRAKAANPSIKIGICGEQACDPSSIGFLESLGLDYISCSPYRLPVARIVAAQEALKAN